MVESLTLKQLVSVMNLNLGKQEGGVNPLVPRVRLWWGGCRETIWAKGRCWEGEGSVKHTQVPRW